MLQTNVVYLQCLCEISRQLACPLLRYCFLEKDGRKLPSPTLPSVAYQAYSSHSSRTTLLPMHTVPVKLLRCWAVKCRISSRRCSGLQIVRTSIQSTMRSGAGWGRVYRSRIRNVNHLKKRLIEEWCDLDHNIICAAVNQWRTRLRACVRADGGHFEHQL